MNGIIFRQTMMAPAPLYEGGFEELAAGIAVDGPEREGGRSE
jgi:hypothetical protein